MNEQHTIKERISAEEVDDTLLDNLFGHKVKHKGCQDADTTGDVS